MSRVICFVGTSLVNQCNTASSTRIANNARSWIHWAHRLSGWRCDTPVWWDDRFDKGWEPSGVYGTSRGFWGLNAGVSGQTGAQILARTAEIAEIPANEYWVDAGTNDMAGTLTAQEIHDNRMEICRRLKLATGARVRLLTVLARGTGSWADPSDARTRHTEVNRLAWAQDQFEVVDFNGGWIDLTSDADIPVAANTVDDIHFSGQGALKVGQKVAEIFNLMPPAPPMLDTASQSLIPAKFFTGTGGNPDTGATGTVPDDIKVERSSGNAAGTAVCSIASDSTVRGSVLNVDFTPSGVAESARWYIRTNTADTTHTKAGKWIQGTVKLKLNQLAFDAIQLHLEDRGTDGLIALDGYDTGDGFITELPGQWYEMRTPPLYMVGDSTTFRFRLEVYIDGEAGQNGDIDVAEFGVVEVPNPNDRYLNKTYSSRLMAEDKSAGG